MTVGFRVHFSTRSENYAQYRPACPDELRNVFALAV